jgi:adenylyltransferase/sulfurtransferase
MMFFPVRDTEATMGYTITPAELKSRLDRGDQLVLLDVREQWEFDTAKLNGSTLIPLATLPHSLGNLKRDAEIIAICHHGMRSADATNFLLQQGFSNVKNLVGGIDAWSAQVDHSVPRY